MHHDQLISLLLFCSLFLIATALILALAKKYLVPYTVLLLASGFIAQSVMNMLQLPTHFEVSTDLIYFLLLPLLLFESAIHINFHQFKLQFKTITFLATVGLLISIAVVTALMSIFGDIPWQVALLFGALISATDPIAVLSIFKNLGAPKRLALIADGESMFNDATGVIAFRVIAGVVIGGGAFGIGEGMRALGSFSLVFLGSIGLGALTAYLTSLLIWKVNNDRLIETTMTIALAIGSFVAAEHFFHLSGVITTVTAGLVMGNLGKTRISIGVKQFMDELWEYIGFLSLSIVFFFSTFSLRLELITSNLASMVVVVIAVLLARAAAVYICCAISNRAALFANEPNVPLSWQHILNWGGLRGVIPLVLVYSIPEGYAHKELLLQFTLITFLFTATVNATTIDKLLVRLGLHLKKKEEEILRVEKEIFEIEQMKSQIRDCAHREYDPGIVMEIEKKMEAREQILRQQLLETASPLEFEQSLRLQAVEIERETIGRYLSLGRLSERAYYDFETELDLQQDALEHPSLRTNTRGVKDNGMIDSSLSFHMQLQRLTRIIRTYPILRMFSREATETLILDRLYLLQARIQASSDVIEYVHRVRQLVERKHIFAQIVNKIESEHETYRLRNAYQLQTLAREEPRTYRKYQVACITNQPASI